MTDYFGFTMASLNENGSLFANPCKGDKNMSTLMYRPFSSWANNSEVIPLYCLFILAHIALAITIANRPTLTYSPVLVLKICVYPWLMLIPYANLVVYAV